MSRGEFGGQELAEERAYLGRIFGGEDLPQRGSAEGKIAEILVAPGQQIDERDLLMRLE